MRKSMPVPFRYTPLVAIVLLSFVACSRDEKPPLVSPTTASSHKVETSRGVASVATPATNGYIEMDSAPADARVAGSVAGFSAAPRAPSVPANAARDIAAPSTTDVALGSPMPSVDVTGAMLVRHGTASIQVKAVNDAVASVRQTAAQFGGFVANTALRAGKDEQRSATLELRVPSDKFDALLSALNSLGKVESVAATAEDVGEEYVDLGARAANARRVEARLVEMLATRTGKLSDVLTVEQELSRVRQEAERYDARMRYLEHRATLSSLDVTIHEPIPLIEQQPGPGPIAEAFAEAWSRLVGVVAWCIASLGLLIPLMVLIGAAAVIVRRMLRGGGKAGELAG